MLSMRLVKKHHQLSLASSSNAHGGHKAFYKSLTRGTFTYFPTLRQKLLATYILAWPIIIPAVFLLFPLGIILMVSVSLPPALAVLSNMSLVLFIAFTLTLAIGFHEFTREYRLRYRFSHILILIFLFYPYTLLLTIASVRAVYRNLRHISVGEKLNTSICTESKTTSLSKNQHR